METAAIQQAPQPLIIQQGGGTKFTPVMAVTGLVLVAGLAYAGKKWYDQHQKNASEEEMDTPAGRIVLQLKTVFESFPVSDTDYKRVALQVTPELKDGVFKLYKKATTRNLSDDIAEHISSRTQTTAAKQEVINTTSGSLLKITPDDKIQFTVGAGSIIRFAPGSTQAIPLYFVPSGIATGQLPVMLQPSAKQFKVAEVKEVPYEGIKVPEDWTKYFRPYVRTRKVFAAVAIVFPFTDSKGNKVYKTMWADARLFRKGVGTNYLKGLGCGDPDKKPCGCKHNLGLVY